jgi:peptidoglycan L-alanyl-D-glutamate endopeptidase CwlK
MFEWGEKSKAELDTVDPDIRRVFDRALSFGIVDIAIIEGRRGRLKQNEYFYAGKSKKMWPHGKHNVKNEADLACAVDAAPFINGKISWKKVHNIYLAGIIMAAAKIEGVGICYGGDWDRDGEPVTDQEFQDLVHYEGVKQ